MAQRFQTFSRADLSPLPRSAAAGCGCTKKAARSTSCPATTTWKRFWMNGSALPNFQPSRPLPSSQKRRGWVRLHEKGGKVNELPCHHNLETFLDEWLSASKLSAEPTSPLFPEAPRLGAAARKRRQGQRAALPPQPGNVFG